MSCCPVCDLLGEQKVAGVERLRGFEIEISAAQVMKLASIQLCSGHLRKCDGRCQRQKLGEPECRCKICTKERGVATTEKPVCPGHPCIDVNEDRTGARMLTRAVGASRAPFDGDFTHWHKTAKNNDYFDLKTDSSCGFEIATPPASGDKIGEVLRPVLAELVKIEELHKGWRLQDEACGLHCTIDISDQGLRGVKRILLATARHQAALLGTQPKYRWTNGACRKFGDVYLGTVGNPGFKRQVTYVQGANRLQEVVPQKYYLVNTEKYNAQGLLEFRFGGAVVDLDKIEAFGVLVECLVQSALERPAIWEGEDRKKRLYVEVIKPYLSDPRVAAAWEGVLLPALGQATLPPEPKAPRSAAKKAMVERGLV